MGELAARSSHRRYAYRVRRFRPRPSLLQLAHILATGLFALFLPACRCPASAQTTVTAPAASSGSIAGQVVSAEGSFIQGAQIALVTAPSATPRQLQSDPDGRFHFDAVPSGALHLEITLPGFVTVQQELQLAPGQQLALAPVVMALDTVNISVDALTPEQAALEELHAAEHQRLLGVLPNFFVSYNWVAPPMSPRQKFALATHNVLDPGNLALAGVTAGVQQALNSFPGYHQGAVGYGKRYGADLADLVAGTYMGGAVLPSLLHQDPRYFYKGTGTKRSRFLYALSRVVVTRGDNGRSQPNVSGVLGDLSAGAISNLYYPASDRQGATLFLENGALGLAGDAMNNVFQEFVLGHLTTRGKKDHQ